MRQRDPKLVDSAWPLQTVSVEGAALHYIEAGAGDPVIFVHGTLGDYRSWFPQVEPLSRSFRVVSYSRRYHFPNRWTGDGLDYSASLHAADLAEVIERLGIAPAHIVSASYGSYVALLHARDWPGQVRSLVVGEPPMMKWLEEMEDGTELASAFNEQTMRPAHKAIAEGRVEEGIGRFIDGVNGAPGAFDRFSPSIRRMVLDNAPEMVAESRTGRLFPVFGCEDAARIDRPVLLLGGERSPPLFRRITDELARCLPQSERHTIPGASHAMNAARPKSYNEIVRSFLARVPQP